MIQKTLVFLGTFILLGLFSFINSDDTQTIWMIGDSTMAIKAENKYPETGWGVPFSHKFKNNISVQNKAKNGRSTKSTISSGTWDDVYNNIKPNDVVIIQFGHNDEKVHKPQVGTTLTEFKSNLSDFVTKTREKKATPILLTPIARRSFQDGKLVDTHGEYPNAVRTVADSLDVNLIDMTTLTDRLLTKKGEAKSVQYFLHLPKGHKNYPNGVQDNTHLNEFGANTIADLVVKEIKRQKFDLKNWLK